MLKRIRALLGRRAKDGAAKPKKAGNPGELGQASRSAPTVHHGPKVVHRPIAITDLDPDAVKIIRRLSRFDHKVYLVGGCVRDLLLDRKPKDFDVGTSATPRQIKRLFRNCRIIGRRFRLAHIYFQDGKIIEVATFRSREVPDAGDADDGADLLIRDDNVFGTPEEDALRRDFTINQLFYDLGDDTVLDHAEGLEDLRRKLVRTIGDPDIRFREDPIRILRAIKFAARLGFKIETETLASLERMRNELDKAAMARVLEELNRFCRGGAARRSFELMGETEVFRVVLPEIADDYARDRDGWSLMLDLLGRMDATRADNGREIRTGEIFTAVLLPLLGKSFGWNTNGKTERPQGLNVRKCVDDVLRPLALRLRVPRREQEHCRQVLGTLSRMVPARRVRRNTRRAILGRECLPDALWMLEALSERCGGDFTEAHAYWTSDEDGTATTTRPATAAGDEEATARPARRGRRRSRRRSSPDRERARETPGETPQPPPKKEGMPPPWDDDYFFAALPSAPESAQDDGKKNRYGSATMATDPADEAGPQDAVPVAPNQDDESARPRRKRRPRRRRRRGGSGDGPASSD